MNRKDFIVRAVECCLACETPHILPYVILIDGKSTDGSYELLREKYGLHPRVRLVQKDPIGFQRTAFFGALEVQTEYATYMYDDDVLSPYYSKLIEEMLREGRDFVMGYGKMFNVREIFPFRPIQSISRVPKSQLIGAFFGDPRLLKYLDMPVSPICCVVKTDFLKNWVRVCLDFAARSEFRHYFMIDQNIGPDEIIYLSNIINQTQPVLLAEQVVGQFSEHEDSMSIRYGGHHLRVGYWIGKIWAFEELTKKGEVELAYKSGAHLMVIGLRILAEMVYFRKFKWIPSVCAELLSVKYLALKKGFLFRMSLYLFVAFKCRFFGKRRFVSE